MKGILGKKEVCRMIFKSKEGKEIVHKKYQQILDSWPVKKTDSIK